MIKGNFPISQVKQGIFRLGELNPNSFFLPSYAGDSDRFCTLNFVLHMSEFWGYGF